MILFHRFVRSPAVWAFLGTFLRLGANVIVLPLILHKLSPEQLGLWYVFGALAGLATLLDFGFEGTVTRTAAYVWGGAPRLVAFGFHDEVRHAEPNRALFSQLLATLQAYYRFVGLFVLLLLLFGGGWWVWLKTEAFPEHTSIRWAWILYALGNALNFISGRWPALLTGIGDILVANQIAIVGLLVYYSLAVVGLMMGWEIWGLVVATLAMGITLRSLGRLVFSRRSTLTDGLPVAKFDREIFAVLWPNAWRLGLVGLGSFMIVQANTLICSAFLGLTITASYGLSFQVVMILSGLSAVWVQVKLPQINQLRVQGEHLQIARIFIQRIRLSILTFLLGTACLIFLGPTALRLIGSKTTLLPTSLLALFCLIQFLEMHHAQYASLVLTENRNPFLLPALLSGAAIVCLSLMLTPRWGLPGMLVSAGLVQAAFNNWWPILRAIRGLNVSVRDYSAAFFHSTSLP